MKRIVLLFSALFIFQFPALAQDADSNWGIQQQQNSSNQCNSIEEKVWQREYDRALYEEYGSDQSPAFLNRENIDSDETDYDSDEAGSEY